MSNPTMLYKHPGPHPIHDGKFDYTIVDADEPGAIDAATEAGWCLTTAEAKAASGQAGVGLSQATVAPESAGAEEMQSRTRKPKA